MGVFVCLENYNLCVLVSGDKINFATRNPEIFCIYYHTYSSISLRVGLH
jgi:hypothetical protein